MKKENLKAFFLHLAISVFLFIVMYLFIKHKLYPGYLFHIDGGKQGLVIVALVDLVLGPLLTLIVYRKGKKGLVFDLSLIAAFQIACLTVGMYVLISERPLALILSYDGFHSVSKSSLLLYDKDNNMFEQWSGNGPKKLYVKLPVSRDERLKLQLSQLTGGPLYIREKLLSHFDQGDFRVSEYSVKIGEIIAMYPEQKDEINRLNQGFSDSGLSVSYMQFTAKYALCYVAFDNQKRQIIQTLPTTQC